MKRLALGFVLSFALLGSSAQAAIIYDNVNAVSDGPDLIDSSNGNGPLGNSFSVPLGGAFEFTDLKLRLATGDEQSTGVFDIYLYSDVGGGPGGTGDLLDTVNDISLSPDTALGGVFSLSGLSFTLGAGQRYWIVLSTNPTAGSTAANWFYSSDLSGTGVAGEFNQNGSGVPVANALSAPYQMQIGGRLAAASSIPEPLTLSLFGVGLIGAATLRRRKKIG